MLGRLNTLDIHNRMVYSEAIAVGFGSNTRLRRKVMPDEEVRGEEEGGIEEGGEEVAEEPRELRGWAPQTPVGGSVFIETGRGQTAEVRIGTPFTEAIERVADEAHYGGYFRVFLNGEELIDPEESPETIELGMRIVLTSYDKVGN